MQKESLVKLAYSSLAYSSGYAKAVLDAITTPTGATSKQISEAKYFLEQSLKDIADAMASKRPDDYNMDDYCGPDSQRKAQVDKFDMVEQGRLNFKVGQIIGTLESLGAPKEIQDSFMEIGKAWVDHCRKELLEPGKPS